jgi:hypothetical protein
VGVGEYDDLARGGEALSRKTLEAQTKAVLETGGVQVETALRRRRDLVHVLTARSGGTDELEGQRSVRDAYTAKIDSGHRRMLADPNQPGASASRWRQLTRRPRARWPTQRV